MYAYFPEAEHVTFFKETLYALTVFPLTTALKKFQLAAGRCRHQITEVDQRRILIKIILVMKNYKHHFYIDVVNKLSF
jgi:hypothetical protein